MTVTSLDFTVLSTLTLGRFPTRSRAAAALRDLDHQLGSAQRVDDLEVPEDVVTVDSIVVLKELSSDLCFCVAIVFPWAANYRENRVSVLSSIGRAVLGRRQGDVVVCRGAGRVYQFRIDEVIFQPEADARQELEYS